jgi:hypothetical protein
MVGWKRRITIIIALYGPIFFWVIMFGSGLQAIFLSIVYNSMFFLVLGCGLMLVGGLFTVGTAYVMKYEKRVMGIMWMILSSNQYYN